MHMPREPSISRLLLEKKEEKKNKEQWHAREEGERKNIIMLPKKRTRRVVSFFLVWYHVFFSSRLLSLPLFLNQKQKNEQKLTLNHRLVAGAGLDRERPVLDVGLDRRVGKLAADEALCVKDGVERVHRDLRFGGVADEALGVGERDVRRRRAVSLLGWFCRKKKRTSEGEREEETKEEESVSNARFPMNDDLIEKNDEDEDERKKDAPASVTRAASFAFLPCFVAPERLPGNSRGGRAPEERRRITKQKRNEQKEKGKDSAKRKPSPTASP